MNENFTPRWGIAQLDDWGYCHIPGFIMRNMSKYVYKGDDPKKQGETVGITSQEFTVMCQIMSFKFDVPESEAKPSLAKIASFMGVSVDTVRRAKNSMQEKGALSVEYHGHEGMPNVYDFGELARQCFAFEQEAAAKVQAPAKMQGVAKSQGRGLAKLQGLPPANLLGKEEKRKRKDKKDKTQAQPSDAAMSILVAFSDAQPGYLVEREPQFVEDAEWLATQYTPKELESYLKHLRKDKFWAMKMIKLSYVRVNIGAWKPKKTVPPAEQPPPQDLPEPTKINLPESVTW